MLLHSLPLIPVIFALEWLYAAVSTLSLTDNGKYYLFCAILPWVYHHVFHTAFFLLVVLQKRLVVGKLGPGATPRIGEPGGQWEAFRYWLHERCVMSPEYDDTLGPWIGTEVLTVAYRMLGSKMGRRVQSDFVTVVEHECLSVGDFVMFGSEVSVLGATSDRSSRGSVRMCPMSNVLDHCCVLPGVTVGEKAVLGTATIAAEGMYLPPDSVFTGNVRGKPMLLRLNASDATPAKEKDVEIAVLRYLDSPVRWHSFNAALCVVVWLVQPIPYLLWVVAALYATMGSDWLDILVTFPLVYLALQPFDVLLHIVLKWLIIGRYKEGNFPFFGSYHFRWMVMMSLTGTTGHIMDLCVGTPFAAYFYRAMGAKVGHECVLFGLGLEFDLLTMGDRVAVHDGVDTTNHTVEKMVIKNAPTYLGDYTSVCSHSMAMPGSVLCEGAVLLEHSQVLKGDTVPDGQVWAGMPAEAIPTTR
mmetsp:Transcript_17747/g.39147  ORF Transcript_17747/g.39147 Transcript_17747/m.39147 type:complete len:470 (-) Transcript_17747:198-1607(-)